MGYRSDSIAVSRDMGPLRPLQDSAIICSTPGKGESASYCANHRVSCKCQQSSGWKIHRFFRWKMPFAVFRSGSGVSESRTQLHNSNSSLSIFGGGHWTDVSHEDIPRFWPGTAAHTPKPTQRHLEKSFFVGRLPMQLPRPTGPKLAGQFLDVFSVVTCAYGAHAKVSRVGGSQTQVQEALRLFGGFQDRIKGSLREGSFHRRNL